MEDPESIQEIVNRIEVITHDLSQHETDTQTMNHHVQEITKEARALGQQTARRFRQMADTLDFLWETCQKAQVGGTSAAILGGILTICGGIATISSAGAATPLMLTGIGFGLSGAGTKIVASFIEAAMNSNEIKKAEEEWKETINDIKNMENKLQELLKKSGKRWPSADRFLDLVRRLAFNSVVAFFALKAEQAAGQVSVQATANVGGKAVPKAGGQELARAGLNTVDDVAGAGAKTSSKALGKMIIGVSAVFLVLDAIERGFTIRDLVSKKGADAAKFLRAKAEELDQKCSLF